MVGGVLAGTLTLMGMTMPLKTVTCPICGRTIEIGEKSQAWCSQWPNPKEISWGQGYGRPHETKEML